VIKLTSGEELLGLVSEAMPDKITIKLPAKLENYFSRGENNVVSEYVKLTNYLSNIKGHEISLSRNTVVYIGQPIVELEKMYEMYFIAMQNDPKSIISSLPPESEMGVENGLQLLNDLFNNDDFVNFVNDLIDNFDGVEIVSDPDDENWGDETVAESPISPSEEPEPKPRPKRKKRKAIKPESKKLPYKPDSPPDSPESWSDNPEDYL
jgi:hypothetical protein